MSEFTRLVEGEFGPARAAVLLRDHVVSSLGHRTAAQALAAGAGPRVIWAALCDEFEVPEDRRWGADPGRPGHGVSRASNTRSV